MTINSKKWEPCYADIERGVAFFDEVIIETDSITDPRRDKILPILETEQIFMCRQMTPLLKHGLWVLDVGTGCGVFAIWAARHGCRVIAVDVNTRALRFAKQNAVKNGITVCDKPEELDQLPGGGICLFHARFDKKFSEDQAYQLKYDLVFLSPPFNPTCPGILAALHAEAGLDGQRCFKEQITLVPKVLKNGGICIGIQMTPIPKGKREPQGLEIIQNAFKQQCHIRYTEVIERKEIEPFLEKQYESYLHSNYDLILKKELVEDYIKKLSKRVSSFAYIYYEVSKQMDYSRSKITKIEDDEPLALPKGDWDRRIWMHKQIVEHASPIDILPSPALFMHQSPFTLGIDIKGVSKDGDISPVKNAFRSSPLWVFDQWIERNEALRKFDLIIVDAAPAYVHTGGTRSLPYETKLWLSDQLKSSTSSHSINDLLDKLWTAWTKNTAAHQNSMTGHFYHKHFVGSNTPNSWADVLFTTLEWNKDSPQIYDDLLLDKTTEKKRRRLFQHVRQTLEETLEELEKHENGLLSDNGQLDYYYGYSQHPLKEINVIDIGQIRNIWQQIYDRVREAYNIPASVPDERIDRTYIRTDLQACQSASHIQLNRRIAKIMSQYLGAHVDTSKKSERPFQWSALMVIPLSLAFDLRRNGEWHDDALLETYRGGIWLLACSSEDWELEHEHVLYDMARLLWLLYNARYNREAAQSSGLHASLVSASHFGHEIKNIARAISAQWLVSSDTVLAEKRVKARWRPMDWKIVPFPDLLRSAGRIISLRAQSIDPMDIFGSQPPLTMEDLLEKCWQLAKEGFILSCSYHFWLTDTKEVKILEHLISSVDKMWNGNQDRRFRARVHSKTLVPAYLSENLLLKQYWMDLVRLLTAVFGNCIKHAALWNHIDVEVKLVENNVILIVSDTKRPEYEQPSQLPSEIQEGVRDAIIEGRQNLVTHPLLPNFSGTDVIRFYAEKRLDGNLTYPQPRSGFDYAMQISLPLKQLKTAAEEF